MAWDRMSDAGDAVPSILVQRAIVPDTRREPT